MSEPPITKWIKAAELRDAAGEENLWNHYFKQIVPLARQRMFGLQTSVYDAEDAAASAIHSLFRGLRDGKFPALNDRHNFWRLIVLITKRKISAQFRRESSRIKHASQDQAHFALNGAWSEEPTAEFVSELMDETEQMVRMLPELQLQRIALLKLDGLSTTEIAEQLDVSSRTIRRKLDRIRDIWGIAEDC